MNQNLANDEQLNKRLASYYQQALDNINKKIDVEASRLMDDNGIINGAYKPVTKEEMSAYEREAKQVVKRANAMRAKGKKVSYKDFSEEVNRHMRIYNATMRLNRLELLKSQVGVELVDATAKTDATLRDKLSNDYTDELKRQAGIMAVTAKPALWTANNIAKIVMAQTNSATFSQRIWANQEVLKAQLDQVISNGLVQGQSYAEMARGLKKNVKEAVNNQRYVTERIARTESARVQYKAQIDSFVANDYRFCKWHAEPGACKLCREIADTDSDGNGRGVYEVDDVDVIPVHPNCRCSVSAYWVDGSDNSLKGKNKHDERFDAVKPSLYREHSIPVSYKPYSVAGKLANNQIIQYRSYGKDGNPKTDYDLTNHGFPKYHPVVPHAHDWFAICNKDNVKYKREKKWRKLNNAEQKNVERWLKYHERK